MTFSKVAFISKNPSSTGVSYIQTLLALVVFFRKILTAKLLKYQPLYAKVLHDQMSKVWSTVREIMFSLHIFKYFDVFQFSNKIV